MNDKKNAFDLLRLVLAFCVVITHSYLIGGYKSEDPLYIFSKGQTDFGEFGVMGFFTLSGYLITASFECTKSIMTFIIHRLLRIFPGYWVCLLITGFAFTPLLFWLNGEAVTGFATGENSSLNYFINNFFLMIKQWSINDVLAASAYKDSLNGSLWSLYPELQCYFLTIVAGYFGLFNKNKILYLIVFIVIAAFFAINFNFTKNYGPTILTLSPALKLYASYAAGSIVYVFKDYLKFDLKGSIFSLLFALLLIKFGGFHLLSPLLIAIVLINLFQLFTLHLKYDISYGVYIYSFTVQQALFLLLGNRIPVVLFILFSFVLAAALGLLSFILIEKPAINFRKKLICFLKT